MKNSFVVSYAVKAWITSMGLTGPLGAFVSFFATRLLGSMLDKGMILVDIKMDHLKEAMKDPKWRKEALKYYEMAGQRLYSEDEKNEIRKQYLAALAAYATYGNGMSDD